MRQVIRLIALCFVGVPLWVQAADHHGIAGREAMPLPRFLELASEQSILTIHFPAGIYSLDLVDDDGYYYRALRRVMRHSFDGFDQQNGGIFVNKSSRQVCAYIVWAGGRTKIGDLSRARISFRDSARATTR